MNGPEFKWDLNSGLIWNSNGKRCYFYHLNSGLLVAWSSNGKYKMAAVLVGLSKYPTG